MRGSPAGGGVWVHTLNTAHWLHARGTHAVTNRAAAVSARPAHPVRFKSRGRLIDESRKLFPSRLT